MVLKPKGPAQEKGQNLFKVLEDKKLTLDLNCVLRDRLGGHVLSCLAGLVYGDRQKQQNQIFCQ